MAETATKPQSINPGPENPAPASSSASQHDVDALNEQIATLRKDISSLTELVGDIGMRRGRDARDRVEAKAREARDMGEERLREAGERISELEGEARGSIRDNPFQAIAIAAAVGFFAGYIGSRR
ncbi:DUF883 family protein [Salipiger mucosus]|uniref:DUF883 domain-containing protein n=1 Tax=Salipiger mucosus DSM 16094 TaxID=1123237 RepID=S9QVE7_9RHOB|nr:DUF883 family protein [Salipiger mucosus]EPX85396.1 hypothetical protein Salmuc_02777 [Salipiger mucosus DSM 16094]